MSQPNCSVVRSQLKRIHSGFGERAAAIVLTLLLEGLLALLLLTLAPSIALQQEADVKLFGMDVPLATKEVSVPSEPETQDAPSAKQAPQPERALPQPVEPQPAPAPLPWIQLSREQMAVADIGTVRPLPSSPAAVRQQAAGPPDTGTTGDTQRVAGQGPHGEPLYAASWYREPYDDELRGYLSTAQGPGWGLIACRTVTDYRVEDCVAVDEYPQGSNITRAVLAAAWQFRVRPPRIGGRLKIGEWVRIRIDYERRR